VSEFRGVGGCAYDCEVGCSEEGAGCCFGCHCVCFVRQGSEAQLSRWGVGGEVLKEEKKRGGKKACLVEVAFAEAVLNLKLACKLTTL
jgi:hypothetical protein